MIIYEGTNILVSGAFLTCFSICKTRVYRGIHYFLIFALNIDLGYSLVEAVLTRNHDLCFEQNKKNIIFFHLKITSFFFSREKSQYIAYNRRVCVMS